METIKEALTFDDVLLLPKYSNILPAKTNIYLKFLLLRQLWIPSLNQGWLLL